MDGGMRILQTASHVAHGPDEAQTALHTLARGYLAAGHSVVQVLPGPEDGRQQRDGVEVMTVRSTRLPGMRRRMITSGHRMVRLLDDVQPDRIEVSDRLTLQAVGRWAQRHGVPTVAISHERLDAALRRYLWHPRLAQVAADFWNLRLAASFDTIVCATDWAGREFERLGAPNLARVPLGVDLTTFHPMHASPSLRRALGAQNDVLIVVTDRLAPEQQPELAIETVRTLNRRGIAARLIVAAEGVPDWYQRRAANLPVTFLGHVCDGPDLGQLLATADVALAWGPLQSAGLAALEALASGTPVVARRDGALVELLHGGGGATADGHAVALANAVTRVMSTDMARRRALARMHAERFARPAMVDRMLAVHQAAARPTVAA
jgi:alpha-1,6-mannosyltransferase